MKKDSITQKTYFYRESLSNNSYKYMDIFSKFKDYHKELIFGKSIRCFLSYKFTKKRPSKIFKIEKNNRQTNCKNALI